MFQFTHPVRGATLSSGIKRKLVRVSIHAPRAGCDSMSDYTIEQVDGFNSRTPCGVRRSVKGDEPRRQVSIHAPRAGCDIVVDFLISQETVSIHAPRAGCDDGAVNPRRSPLVSIHAPRAGCDAPLGLSPSAWLMFQFTHPVRGATLRGAPRVAVGRVSIHAPRAGCD